MTRPLTRLLRRYISGPFWKGSPEHFILFDIVSESIDSQSMCVCGFVKWLFWDAPEHLLPTEFHSTILRIYLINLFYFEYILFLYMLSNVLSSLDCNHFCLNVLNEQYIRISTSSIPLFRYNCPLQVSALDRPKSPLPKSPICPYS